MRFNVFSFLISMINFILAVLLSLSSVSLLAQHSVERLLAPINTDLYDEICPVMSYGEDYLFFTKVGSPDFVKVLMENGLQEQLEHMVTH